MIEVAYPYVGQVFAILIDTDADPDGESPQVSIPPVPGAAVTPWGPSSPGETGSGRDETQAQGTGRSLRLRVVARAAGRLTIPPMAIRQGGRTGRTGPIALDVASPPPAGRTAEFLGGVGRVAIGTAVDTADVRVGRPFEYRVTLEGPGSAGSVRTPDLGGLRASAARPQVEALPAEAREEPPRRTFRFRVRPTRDGELVIPPVFVATFDPPSRRYLRHVGPSVRVRVAAVPRFSAAEAAAGFALTDEDRAGQVPFAGRSQRVLSGCVALAVGAVTAWALATVRNRRRNRPHRLAARLARRFGALRDDAATAAEVDRAFAHFVTRVLGRAGGATTPEEARRVVEGWTGDEALGFRAAELVAECDEARFSGGPAIRPGLSARAEGLFRGLARSRPGVRTIRRPPTSRSRGPRP